jgi:hypothetical protein
MQGTYLIRAAKPPDMRIMTQRYVGTVLKTGILSMNGTAKRSMTDCFALAHIHIKLTQYQFQKFHNFHLRTSKTSQRSRSRAGVETYRNRRLVKQKLTAAHIQLLMIAANKHRINGASTHTTQGKEDSNHRRRSNCLSWSSGLGLGVVVGGDSHTQADGDQNQGGIAGNGGPVENVVYDGCHGGQEDPAELVDCYC